MNSQPKWDIYESVVLLNGYLLACKKSEPRAYIIRRVSADLRAMAIHRGRKIDEIFRNENGISYQMQSVDSAYKGRKIYVPATKLFQETVSLYRNQNSRFQELLKEARYMIEHDIAHPALNDTDVFVVDFNDCPDMSFARVNSLTYRGQAILIRPKWRDLYIALLKKLYADYSNEIDSVVGKVYGRASAPFVGNCHSISLMRSPGEFAPDRYVELNISATTVIVNIKTMLDICGTSYEDVNITYTKGNKDQMEALSMKEENGEKVRVIPNGTILEKIDIPAMVEANKDSLAIIEQITVKKIYDVYKRRQKSLDCFHVAFSGGKDSIVLLELVKKALPRSSYMVVFGDTKMEFPDTYELVDIVEKQCKEEGINFYRAASHFEPEESWRLFGPPSRVLRWCCTVHKAAPQTLKIREVLGKNDYVGMDFVGVRAHESATRATYDEENFGKKQKGQYSHNPILEWTSAEIWLYIFSHNLPINNTYKKGNSRAGCLFCPMGGGKSDSFRYLCYKNEIDKYTDIIRDTIADKNINTYITNGGWIERKNGRDIIGNETKYTEETIGDNLVITIKNPSTDWHEWIKTLGEVSFEYDVEQISNGFRITVPKQYDKSSECKLFKQVFHKAAYCVKCGVCEANCRNGCISFKDGLVITNCLHCKQCHNIDDGCLAYHSMQLPKNGGRVMKSINTFADHAPKIEWIQNFFEKGNEFFTDNMLGPMQISMFKRFLSDAKLAEKNKTTQFYDIKTTFRMYNAPRAEVELLCDNSVMDAIIDRFGPDVQTYAGDLQNFRVIEEIAVGKVFFNWIFGFEGKVRIKGPESVKKQYREMVMSAMNLV